MNNEPKDFDWFHPPRDAIAIREQAAVAVYRNPAGDVVIRQQRPYPEPDDIVVISADRLEALITSLQLEQNGIVVQSRLALAK